tara:strand:- start:5036 stop:6286 length:1251 start_codon:yes stop_codon:yes gene_type:complete
MRKKVLLKGPLLTRSGYGEQARFALRSLRSKPELYEVFIQPLQWGKTSWVTTSDEDRQWIDQTIEKTIGYIQQGGKFDISLQVTIPNEWEKIAPYNVGYTAGIETTKVASEWLMRANNMVDNIIVVSNHSKNVFENTVYTGTNPNTQQPVELRLQTPVTAVNYPVKVYDNLPDLSLDLDYDFNFLAVAQYGPRKNLNNTIKWFIEEFQNEEVGLVLKTNLMKNSLMDREQVQSRLQQLMTEFPERKCKIYLLHGDMSDEEMHSLYAHPQLRALLALPHGEGFGLPIFEASYTGMPVIATGWSGQLDFLCDESGNEHFYNVAFDLAPVQKEVVWENVLIEESMWAFPREVSAKEQMRQCYEDILSETGQAASACEYATTLQTRFSEENMYEQFCNAFYTISEEETEWLDQMSKIEIV